MSHLTDAKGIPINKGAQVRGLGSNAIFEVVDYSRLAIQLRGFFSAETLSIPASVFRNEYVRVS